MNHIINKVYVWKISQYGDYRQNKIPNVVKNNIPDFITNGEFTSDRIKFIQYDNKFYEIYCMTRESNKIIWDGDELVYCIVVFEMNEDGETVEN